MTDQQIKQVTYAAILLLWCLLGLWHWLMSNFYRFVLSGPERVFWFLFFIGLPLLVVFGIHYQRKWSGWLTMVFGTLLIFLVLRLTYEVIRQINLPDIGLVILAPMLLVGGHMAEKGYALHQLWWVGTAPKLGSDVAAQKLSVTFAPQADPKDQSS